MPMAARRLQYLGREVNTRLTDAEGAELCKEHTSRFIRDMAERILNRRSVSHAQLFCLLEAAQKLVDDDARKHGSSGRRS